MGTVKPLLNALFGAFLAVNAGVASANLIFDDDVDTTGTGFGTQANILTLHDTGGAGAATDVEDGTVAWDGTAQTCTGTDVVCDAGKTSLYTFGQLDLDAAEQIILIWNPDEVGSSVQTQVDEATLTIYNQDGSTFFSASLAAPVTFTEINHNGVGGEGFGFRLDTTEADELNTLLAGLTLSSRDNLIIGFHSSVSFVDNGPDTWTIQSLCPEGETCGSPPEPCTVDCGPQQVPEPQPLLLIAIAALALGAVRLGRPSRSR
jgi:hypothetical protein